MPPKIDPLDSPRYRLEHAKRHAKTVESEFMAFMDERPYRIVAEDDPSGQQKIFKLKLIKPMPRSVAGFTDDAFGNLRSALDQIGYATAKAFGGKGKKCSFPFGDSETEARSRIRGNSIELPNEIFDLMISFQPYAGGDDVLWSLNEICNTGKHRVVRPVFSALGGYSIKNVSLTGNGMIGGGWDSSKNELLIASVGAGSDFSIDELQFSSFVALGDIKIVGGQPALGIFNALARKVESILIAVEAEGRRIRIFS